MTVAGSSKGSLTPPSEQAAPSGRKRASRQTPITLLHGFTQTSVSWRPVVDALGDELPDVEVITPDLPGHGAADPPADDSPLARTAEDLADRIGRSFWVGYSMGGRVALRVALDHPAVVAGLLVLGATAGMDDPAERADRRRSDGLLADTIERDGVEPFLTRWLDQPLFAGLAIEDDDLRSRRDNRPEGLAASLRHAGTGTMDPPWWPELARLTMPVTVVAGELDQKFDRLADRLVSSIGNNAKRMSMAGCGHAAHLESPARFAELVARAYRRVS